MCVDQTVAQSLIDMLVFFAQSLRKARFVISYIMQPPTILKKKILGLLQRAKLRRDNRFNGL